jgi:hypothetical protein
MQDRKAQQIDENLWRRTAGPYIVFFASTPGPVPPKLTMKADVMDRQAWAITGRNHGPPI